MVQWNTNIVIVYFMTKLRLVHYEILGYTLTGCYSRNIAWRIIIRWILPIIIVQIIRLINNIKNGIICYLTLIIEISIPLISNHYLSIFINSCSKFRKLIFYLLLFLRFLLFILKLSMLFLVVVFVMLLHSLIVVHKF
jgi:hypothetical protein